MVVHLFPYKLKFGTTNLKVDFLDKVSTGPFQAGDRFK